MIETIFPRIYSINTDILKKNSKSIGALEAEKNARQADRYLYGLVKRNETLKSVNSNMPLGGFIINRTSVKKKHCRTSEKINISVFFIGFLIIFPELCDGLRWE